MTARTIYIARDFSPSPAGRYPADGPFNGEKFRETLLLPAMLAGMWLHAWIRGATGARDAAQVSEPARSEGA